MSQIDSLMSVMSENFYISPILIIPPLLVIAMVVFKVPALPGLMGGVVLGAICALIFQGANIGELAAMSPVTVSGLGPMNSWMRFLQEAVSRHVLHSRFDSLRNVHRRRSGFDQYAEKHLRSPSPPCKNSVLLSPSRSRPV